MDPIPQCSKIRDYFKFAFFFNLTKNKIQENRRTNKQDCFDLVNECNTDVGLACIGNNTQKQCL